MTIQRSTVAIGITLLVFLLFSSQLIAQSLNNSSTSVAPLTDAGFACRDSNSPALDLSDKFFEQYFDYFLMRSSQLGLTKEHVVCELGEPNIHSVSVKLRNILDLNAQPGEYLLVYGDSNTVSPEHDNAVIVISRADGLVRQLLFLKPKEKKLKGMRVDLDTNETFVLKRKYTSGGA